MYYELKCLSLDFFKQYDALNYPEIEHKPNRPYVVFLIKIKNNTFAIPFRTNVKHNACYKFKNSSRNTNSYTGLDYSKAVIVNNPRYIGNNAIIDHDEYIELSNKFHFIIKQFTNYVKKYRKYVDGKLNVYEAKKYQYSTLKYFHKELGI